MKEYETALSWAKGIEEHQDGVARTVDVTDVKVGIDPDSVDSNDITDKDTETLPNTDGGDEVTVKEGDISKEDFDAVATSGNGGGKEIDAFSVDPATGLPRRYVIRGFNAANNAAIEPGDSITECVIVLQNGTLTEAGVNGVTAEDLLKVVEEIFMCYQESQFACDENEQVLQHVRGAQGAMAKRFNRRAEEGTEGTHEGN